MRSILALLAGCLALVGCGSLPDRSLIFFTHTTVGVEVAVEPNTTAPGRVVIGYKRAEGVLNPVYLPPEDTYDPTTGKWSRATSGGKVNDYYRDQAYSVIAKFAGEARGRAIAGTSGEATAEAFASMAQWFATGKAADTLASQPGIAGAVTGSPKIAEAAAGARLADRFGSAATVREDAEFVMIHNRLRSSSDAASREAARKLDGEAAEFLRGIASFDLYEGASGTYASGPYASHPIAATGSDFPALVNRRNHLRGSVESLDRLFAESGTPTLNGTPVDFNDAATRRNLNRARDEQRALLDRYNKAITQGPTISSALTLYFHSIMPPSQP